MYFEEATASVSSGLAKDCMEKTWDYDEKIHKWISVKDVVCGVCGKTFKCKPSNNLKY